MMTQASQSALQGLRDLSTLKWYVIPLLAIVFYIYSAEIKKARQTGNWNALFAGLTVFGMDFINETWNGWVFHFSQFSAVWTTPGDTALRTMVGWNIEIMFMFAIGGIVFYNSLGSDPPGKIFKVPEDLLLAVGYSAFCVFVECVLNKGGHLVWEYALWNRSWAGVWLVFLIGYFPFFLAALLIIRMKKNEHKALAVGVIYAIPVVLNIIGLGIMGWTY